MLARMCVKPGWPQAAHRRSAWPRRRRRSHRCRATRPAAAPNRPGGAGRRPPRPSHPADRIVRAMCAPGRESRMRCQSRSGFADPHTRCSPPDRCRRMRRARSERPAGTATYCGRRYALAQPASCACVGRDESDAARGPARGRRAGRWRAEAGSRVASRPPQPTACAAGGMSETARRRRKRSGIRFIDAPCRGCCRLTSAESTTSLPRRPARTASTRG